MAAGNNRNTTGSTTSRRSFLAGVGATLLAARGGLAAAAILDQAAVDVPNSTGNKAPRFAVPPLSCDSHMHIYDSRYPVDPRSTLRPADALVGDYRKPQQRLGTMRNVVVTPSTYGTDNASLYDALAQLGDRARGVAVVDPSVTDAELKLLSAAGTRGIRFNLTQGSVTSMEMVEPLAKRIAELGWHVQINMHADDLPAAEPLFSRLPVPVVFDHIGHFRTPPGVDHPGFAVVRRLLNEHKAWVKLSGAYIESKTGAPSYADSGEIARALIRIAPDRMVWGSDWPHPAVVRGDKPDDALLLDLLHDWAPDEVTWRQILVANPARLYGF